MCHFVCELLNITWESTFETDVCIHSFCLLALSMQTDDLVMKQGSVFIYSQFHLIITSASRVYVILLLLFPVCVHRPVNYDTNSEYINTH